MRISDWSSDVCSSDPKWRKKRPAKSVRMHWSRRARRFWPMPSTCSAPIVRWPRPFTRPRPQGTGPTERAMASRYHLRLPDPAKARGSEPGLAFRALSAEGFAEELESALREDGLFQRWKTAQPDPDAIDPGDRKSTRLNSSH